MKELAEDDDAFLQPADALARPDGHRGVLERLGRARLVGTAETHGEPRAPAREHIEARPLMGEEHRVAVDEGRHASDTQPHARRHAGERGEERHRLEARLGEQAVADPDGVESSRGLGVDREVDQVSHGDLAEHHRPVGENEAEGWSSHQRPPCLSA